MIAFYLPCCYNIELLGLGLLLLATANLQILYFQSKTFFDASQVWLPHSNTLVGKSDSACIVCIVCIGYYVHCVHL